MTTDAVQIECDDEEFGYDEIYWTEDQDGWKIRLPWRDGDWGKYTMQDLGLPSKAAVMFLIDEAPDLFKEAFADVAPFAEQICIVPHSLRFAVELKKDPLEYSDIADARIYVI